MSRRPVSRRSVFFRTDARKTTRSIGGSNDFSRRLHHETLEKRELLAADLLAIRPDAGALISQGTKLSTPPREFSLLFNGDANLDENSINNDTIRLVRAGADGTFGTADDVQVSLGYVGFVEPGDTNLENLHKIMLRPASTASHNATDPSFAFPDDLYRIEIIGSGSDPLRDRDGVAFNDGHDSITPFRLDRGIQVIAVIPQPIQREGDGSLTVHNDRVDVYFDDQEIATAVAENPAFYRLVDTAGRADEATNPDSVEYFPGENRVQLTFATTIPAATYRLDVGSSLAPTGSSGVLQQHFFGEIGTSFPDLLVPGAAGDFGSLSSGTSVKVASEISAAGSVSLPARPGGLDEPGHRQIQLEGHFGSSGLGPVAPRATQIRYYSFPDNFPANSAGIVYKNFISPAEKDIARGILEIYAQQIGVEFVESNTRGGTLVIGKGDLQAADPEATSGVGGIAGLGGGNLVVLDKDDFAQSDRFFGDGFTGVAFHEIGHALGLGHAYDVPAVMGGGVPNDGTGTSIQPGHNDLVHLRRISPPNANDIDLYRFKIVESGRVQIETTAERLATPSLLNTVLRLFRKNEDGTSELVAQNDRYYGSDSLIEVDLPAGEYFFGVSSAGNDNYDPAIANSGFGGTTDGDYEVQLSFTATPTAAQQLTDVDGTAIDGDGDGSPGGVHSFWFESNPDAIFVDKLAAPGGTGTSADPFNSISPALAAAQGITAGGTARALVRIVGNVDETSPTGLRDATPYLIGSTRAGGSLADGNSLIVPKGTTVRVEAGALIKMRSANIDVGTSSIGADRSGGAIQVLGTPTLPVYLRSYHDDQAGGDSDGNGPSANGGDYGGIVLRDDSDLETSGIFLNTINHADIRHGGGKGSPTDRRVFSPIDINDARPTITFNTITDAAKAAVSASPNSFDDSLGRIGPDILGNYLRGNTDNGLFVGIPTELGSSVQKMTVSGRFDDTDITHILTESLIIVGNPGGPIRENGVLRARPSGRLMIDPGTVIKLREARIESERGAATLIAEGTANSPIIFTSVADSRYGGSGVFQTNSGTGAAKAGDWGGLFFSEATRGSLDHTVIAFGGGVVPTAATAGGASDRFNAVEIHQADVRIANSLITNNASGDASGNRFGRGNNQAAAIYVHGAQPILIDNQIVGNAGPAININAGSLQFETQVDRGRSIGSIARYSQFDDNRGPLIRLNQLDDNNINGLKIRGEELSTQSVWDDSDIVHVLDGQITVGNHHTYSGLRLQSNVSESLVVKVDGTNSGFTATGKPLDIVDRIGGTIQVIGLPGYPVVITHLADDSVGAGFTPDGHLMTDTNNGGGGVGNQSWQGFKFDEWSNDRNVAIIREAESPLTGGESINSNPITKAQPLGVLAPDLKSGDENRRLGFQVHGYISPDDAKDEDVYSFQATAGTEVWIDIDRTNTTLDAVFDVVLDDGSPTGVPVFTSDNSIPIGQPGSLTQEPLLGGDYYSLTNNDPGAALILGATGTYYVRVRAAKVDHDGNPATAPVPVSKGEYQLQVRLRQIDEFPGSTVRYADVRYASTAFDVQGLPRHSPLVGDAAEAGDAGGNVTGASSQQLVNLLETDIAAISVAGSLSNPTDVDVYQFDVKHVATQNIPGVTTDVGTVAVVFDMDYADKKRGDTSIAVFDENSRLIFIGRESNIEDDQPAVGGDGQSLDDLSRGSLGTDDPYIGPVHLISGMTYYVAVMSNQVTPSVVASQFSLDGPNGTGDAGILTRLEPINSVDRVVEDHIGFTGYLSSQNEDGGGVHNIQPTTGPLLQIDTSANLDTHVTPFRLQDIGLFVATDSAGDDGDNLYTVDPLNGGPVIKDLTPDDDNLTDGRNDIQDIVIRGDGVMYGYRRNVDGDNMVGQLVTLDPFDGTVLATQNDNIPGVEGFSNVRDVLDPPNPYGRTRAQRADEVVNSDEVDAVTFRRNGDTGGDEPAPRYETFYSVRESDNASRLYRGNANGDASPAAPTNTPTNRYGFVGNIQPAGVTFAQSYLNVNNANPDNFQSARILLRSNIPGEAGNFDVVISTGTSGPAARVSLNGDTIELRLRRAGDPSRVDATAGEIVNAINSDAVVKKRVIAMVYSGNATTAGDGDSGVVAVGHPNSVAPTTNGIGTADEVLQGRVTGLSMSRFDGGGNLFGVTSAGEFISISRVNGTATVLRTVPNVSFSGLALGPQNAEGGRYQNTLFASTTDGQLFAFHPDGTFANVFDSGNTSQSIQVFPGGVTDGDFTLTFNDGGNRLTTLPIAANAPTITSVNERQTISTHATYGDFKLSVEKSLKAVSSLQTDINATDTTIPVQAITTVSGVADFPATPFVIQVESEQMLVSARTGNNLSVVRGHNGTTGVAHADTETVSEVITSNLAASINATTTSITVTDTTPLPTSFPYEIRIGNEDLRVTGPGTTANTLNVARGINGTTAAASTASATIKQIQTTGNVEFNASPNAIRSALQSLDFVGTGNIVVTGSLANGATIEFRNRLGNLNIPSLTTVTEGLQNNELQVIDLGTDEELDDGTFTLSFAGETTAPIAFDATANEIQGALELLPNIGAGNIKVTKIGNIRFQVEFMGTLGNVDQPSITADSSLLINNERQVLTIAGGPTGGTFTLAMGTATATTLPYNANANQVQAAIVGLLNQLPAYATATVADVNVIATGGGRMEIDYTGSPIELDAAGDPVLDPAGDPISYDGKLQDKDIPHLIVDGSGLTGGTANATTQTLEHGDSVDANVSVSRPGRNTLTPVTVTNNVQGVRSVQDALLALTSISANDIQVRGELATGVTVQFIGAYAGQMIDLLDVDDSLMLGATAFSAMVGTVGDGVGDDSSTTVTGMHGSPIGLAFSPLDFNLWHPTMQRANDAGHGVNAAPDHSRNLLGDDISIADGITNGRTTSQGSGGASFYFGLEQWKRNPNENFHGYLSPTDRAENSQYGLNRLQHQDLSSNANIRNTYDLSGGAKGALTTNEFSLSGADYYDRPTLYFNYLLATEAATGKNISDINANNFFRDSARVYASRNGGVTWELLATNNSTLSGTDATDGDASAELPTFLSHVADAGENSSKPQRESRQIVQELFDADEGNPLWHQARIDLSPFAGESAIKLRFDFSTSGSSIEGNLPGDSFGDVGDKIHSVGGSNNNHEGFYIDDILVGFAERGEMVTNAPATTDNAFVDLADNPRSNVKRDENALSNQLSGDYQLEMRRTGEYAFGTNGTIVVAQTFDTNARHILNSMVGTGLDADRNKQREQGLLVLENNILSDSRVVGINVAPPAGQGDGHGVTFPGATQNFSDKDSQRLVPGVVIQNNIIVGSSGVDYSGQPNGTPQAPVPIGRIINNTFIGNDNNQFGVNFHDNASPTLLNNVFSTLGNGIVGNVNSAVVDNNYFNNAGPVRGSDPRSGTDPLFIDPSGRNYYPLSTAGTINNSQDVLNDRGAYAAFKGILGIPQSPYFAPKLDAFGQLRVSGGIGGDGAGPNTDIDIGAADYSDFLQPYAKLLNPVDQDDAGLDSDPAETFIQLDNPDVQAFSVLLSDGENSNSPFEGTGIDPSTVNASTVLIRQDNRLLQVGRDFNLAFNPSTGELRLTPLSDLWNPNSVYEIILVNGDQKAVTLDVSDGSAISDGDQITVTNGSQSATLEFDSGYVVQLGAADAILDGQTFEYSTATGTNGYTARFQINKLPTVPAGTFTGEIRIGRTPADDDVTVNVTDPAQFAVGDFIRISDEIMAVVGVDAATAELTVSRAVLGTPRGLHQAGGDFANRVELVDQGRRAVIDSALGNTAIDDTFAVFQGSELGLDPDELARTGMMTFIRIDDEFMRVLSYDGATGALTVERGALGSAVTSHSQFAVAEVIETSRGAALSSEQTVILDDMLLDGITEGLLAVTGNSLLASDRVVEVTPDADFVPKIGDLLQIGTEIVKITDIQTGPVAGDLSLTIDRGLFDTAVVEHTATITEMVAGAPTTYPTPIRLIDSAFHTVTLFESDPLDDVKLRPLIADVPGQVQSGIASKIARAMREFGQDAAGDLSLHLPHAQGIQGGRIYIGGRVGDTIMPMSGSNQMLPATLVDDAMPGVSDGAIAVPFIPSKSFPQTAVNAAILDAINNSENLDLTGVSEGGGGFYLVSNSGGDVSDIHVTSTGAGFTTTTSDVHGIADKAGNRLRPNRSTQTRFTIGVGPTAYDFGDGVDTADPNNRARHTVLGLGDELDGDPRLGSLREPDGRIVDSEDGSGLNFNLANVLRDDTIVPSPTMLVNAVDAVATTIEVTSGTAATFVDHVGGYLLLGDEVVRLNAIGAGNTLTITRGQLDSVATGHAAATVLTATDDENGLDLSSVDATFNIARTTTTGGGPVIVNVMATDYGVVDGWIDFNHNGKLDVGDNPTNYDERVFHSVAVWPGENFLPVTFPESLPGGATITGDMVMRLRISKLGGLSADGLAIGGEVEDHRISIVAGVPPTPEDLNFNTPDGSEPKSFETTEYVLGGAATMVSRKIFNASTDADGDAISILEIVDLTTGRAYPVNGGTAVINQVHDSLGRLAGSLIVSADSTVTFLPRTNYDSSPVPGPDNIPGTADDITPTLNFGYRLVDSTGVAAHDICCTIPPALVRAVNQPPTLDPIAMTSDASIDLDALFEDQDLDGDGITDTQTVTLTGISAGGGNIQPVRVTATTTNLADNGSGVFVDAGSQSPLLITGLDVVGLDGAAYDGGSSHAKLVFTTTADQYGTASITVTVTDPGADGDFSTTADNLITTRVVTVTVAPVNDKPATVERLWTQIEAAEGAGDAPISFAFTAADLAGTSGTANPFDDKTRVDAGGSGEAPFNEENQLSTLTVSKLIFADNAVITYTRTDASGSTPVTQTDRTLEFADLFDPTAAVTYGDVTVTFSGSDGETGTLVVKHSDGSFDSAVYTPEVDANDNYDGVPQELKYVISDSGVSIAPKVNSGDADAQLGTTDPIESNPETIRFSITPIADSPVLGAFRSGINIDETQRDDDPSNDSYTLELADLFTDADQAFLLGAGADETGTVPASWITITANPGNPTGLLGVPKINQTAENDPISLTFTPLPNAYGVAEFSVSITNPNNGLSSAIGTLPITVNPVNDAPVTSDRIVTGQEDIAYSFNINDLIHTADNPSRASQLVGDGVTPPMYDESEQDLVVYGFKYLDTQYLSADYDEGPGVDVQQLVELPNGDVTLTFRAGVFVSGTFTPDTDYFAVDAAASVLAGDVLEYFVIDAGNYDMYGPGTGPDTGTSVVVDTVPVINPIPGDEPLVATASITFMTEAVNDEPRIPAYTQTVEFYEDQPTSVDGVLTTNIFADPTTDVILPGPLNESPPQTMVEPITLSYVSGTAGMFANDPTLSLDGTLSTQPLADAFGTAVFEITLTDSEGLTTLPKPQITITIEAVNDQPITYDRLIVMDEAIEPATVSQTITAEDLLLGNQLNRGQTSEQPAVNAHEDINPLFAETDTLEVAQINVPDQNGNDRIFRGDASEPSQVVTANGGVLTLTFAPSQSLNVPAGTMRFVSAVYVPEIDYNETSPSSSPTGTDDFQYVIRDSGLHTTDPVADIQHRSLSEPAMARIRVVPQNDPPTIPTYTQNVVFYEDQPTSVDGVLTANLFVDPTSDMIYPGPPNERTTQTMVEPITLSYVSGTAGMFANDPTLSLDGTLSTQPLADAFGTAVFEITLTDSEGLTTLPKPQITITIDAVNDQPITYDRLIVMDEAIEPATVSQTITAEDLLLGNQLNRGQTSEQPAVNAHEDINPLFAETDTLEVAQINVPDQNGNDRIFRGDASEPSQVVTANGGVLTLTFAPSQSLNVPAGTMRFVSAVYVPEIDYNETSPSSSPTGTDDFQYVIRDSGLHTTDPVADIQHRSLSEPATARIRVVPQNDPPTIPTYTQNVVFYEDQPTSFTGILQANIFADPTTDLIFPGPLNERTTQTMVQPITLSYVSGTAGMFADDPTLSLNGTLSTKPLADAFGSAVYEITLTDSEGATTTPKPRLTITIDPVNDQPVAYNRSIIMDEAVEPATVSQTITAEDLILGNRLNRGETVERPAINAHAGINPLFAETDTLEIAQIIVPDSSGNPRPFHGAPNEPSEVMTATGGVLTLTFAPSQSTNAPAGTMRFVSAVYVPAVDYNQTTPYFKVTDDFQFVVRDSGLHTTDQDALLQHRSLSAPAYARISVVAKNDPPVFPTLEITNNTLTFTEIEVGNTTPQRKDVYASAGTRVQAGPDTALDELALQTNVGVRFTPISAPMGLMASLPTMTNDGVIEVYPNPDAFGDAVYDVIASDGILNAPAQRITIAIAGTNDAPTAPAYAFTTLEDQPITIHDVDIDEDLSAGARASSLPVDSPFNESGQDLQVVGIGMVDANDPATNLPTPVVVATDSSIPYVFDPNRGTETATQQIKTPHGTLDVTFQQRVNGELATGFISQIQYTPDPGYNDTLPDDTFTYFVSDYGSTPVPGSNPPRDLVIPTDVASKLSPPARVSVSVGPVNTPPTVPEFENNGVFVFDEDATVPDTILTKVFLDDSLVIDAGGGADEADQTVQITLTTNDTTLASQLFSAPPTLSFDGTLEVFLAPNAFGTITYTLSVVDLSPDDDVLTNPPITQDFTIVVNSVNDQPTAAAKAFSLSEHREDVDASGSPIPTSDGNGYRDIAADTLLLSNAAGGAAQPSSFVDTFEPPFNEASQLGSLRVIGVGLPGATAPVKSANDPSLVYGDVSGELIATDTLDTANGTLTITYLRNANDVNDQFIKTIRYTPDADYNSAAPFDPTDLFTYFVDDGGTVNHLSEPATVTMSVTPTNDLPSIPALRSDTANAAEFVVGADGGPYSTNVFSISGAVILPGPAPSDSSPGARDENANSTVHIELEQVSGTIGMFDTEPTLTDNGTLSLDANPAAFGSAVFDIVVSERDLDGKTDPRLDQVRREHITITLSSKNEVPTAPSRILEMLEFSELENGTGDPVTDDPTTIEETEARLLDLTGSFEGPAFAGGNAQFPEIQTLHVTGIGLPGETAPTVSGSSLIGDYTLNPVNGKLEASHTFTLNNGLLTVTFVEVSSGGTTERHLDRLSYVPDTDYNTQTPGITPDQFTYFVTDSGTPPETSAPALVTLQVNPNNDVPTFTVNSDVFGPNETLYAHARNDGGTTTFPGLISNASPGPETAIDEQANQTVVFRYQPADSVGTNGTDLSTLFRREPDLIDGTLYLYPADNATGTATLVFRADDGPDSRINPNTKYQELTLKLDIGSRPIPGGTIRSGTFNNPADSGVAIVDLNDVFISTDGLDLSKTEILTNGAGGVASINPNTGELEYRPNPGHIGEDTVIIQVTDNGGVKSGPVEVQFNTTRFRLTNPVIAEDVNRNGVVTALDALMIINLLNAQEENNGVPIGSIQGDDYFYDVSDNGVVTSLDALRVINYLNEQGPASSPEPLPPQSFAPQSDTVERENEASVTLDVPVSTIDRKNSQTEGDHAGTTAEFNVLELIAIDQTQNKAKFDAKNAHETNLDAVIGDLF